MIGTWSFGEIAAAGFLYILLCALMVWAACWVGDKFIALASAPTQRARWTVAIAYFVATTAAVFSFQGWLGLASPLAAAPGAMVAYVFLLKEYQTLWYDDPADIPSGVGVANSDWRLGLLLLVAAIALAALRRLPLILSLH